ncbi:hypothetical protein C2G38_2221838 [Gigaspora rosea]|uniref:Uncharacterized protein n=1 Tax=Gigaspora rosea TaxID=44941 RepID=A0A397UC11_9GLOM|nr:hypothetical protein C2G38_2221838 [Gigaspora rosea]
MDMDMMDMDKNLKKGGYKKLGSRPGKMSSGVLITDREERSTIKSLGHSWDTWDAGTLGHWDMAKKGWDSENVQHCSGVLITDREERSTIKSSGTCQLSNQVRKFD